MSNFLSEQHLVISSYDNFWFMIQLLVEALVKLLDGPFVPEDVVLHALDPRLEGAGHLQVGPLLMAAVTPPAVQLQAPSLAAAVQTSC